MIQSHAERMKKSWEPFRIYQLTRTANQAIICEIGLYIINGMSKMALPLYSNFFSLISDGLGGVPCFGRIEGTAGQWRRAALLLALPALDSY